MTQEIKIALSDLSIEDINAILISLQELPAKICNPLSDKIRAQASNQIQVIEGQQNTGGRIIQHNLAEGIATADKLS